METMTNVIDDLRINCKSPGPTSRHLTVFKYGSRPSVRCSHDI